MHRVVHALRCSVIVTFGAVVVGCGGNVSGDSATVREAAGLPGATSSAALLYVGRKHHIDTFTYPGGAPAGTITTKFRVVALCSDPQGNVFAVGTPANKDASGAVYEYAHGGTTPIETIALPKRELPVDCSRDPSSSALAVTSYDEHNFRPQLNVYARGSGTPQIYTNHALGAAPQPAYDDSGDVFVTSGGNVGAELISGSKALTTITTQIVLGGVAHAQWDGTYFALQSFTVTHHQGENTFEQVYRLRISGSKAKLAGLSHFAGWYARSAGRSWISGSTIVVAKGQHAVLYNYPAGGKRVATIDTPDAGTAVTVSAGT